MYIRFKSDAIQYSKTFINIILKLLKLQYFVYPLEWEQHRRCFHISMRWFAKPDASKAVASGEISVVSKVVLLI